MNPILGEAGDKAVGVDREGPSAIDPSDVVPKPTVAAITPEPEITTTEPVG